MAEELRQQQAAIAAEEQRKKQEMDEEKERQRQAVIREAQSRQQQKVETLQEKIQSTESHMVQLAEQREAEARVRSEVQRQKELDKQDCVKRSKFMEEYRISKLQHLSKDKTLRVERLQHQQETLKERRKNHRQEAERTRIVVEEVTPGPSDFVPTVGNVGSGGPAWKMGLPASAMMNQVVQKNVAAPGYFSSPGPCVYQYEKVFDARHRRPEAFSMIRHDRWTSRLRPSVASGAAVAAELVDVVGPEETFTFASTK
jgi:hypothetical protein